MKKTLLASIALIAAIVQADELAIPHISVFGEARVEAAPDEMVWLVEARTEGPDVGKVAEGQDATVRKALAFLAEQGIESKKIQTSQSQFGERYDYRSGSQIRVGYFAQTTIGFRSRELDKYRVLWVGFAKQPGISVRSTGWNLSNERELVAEAQARALRNAKDKAEALAAGLGNAKVNEALRIEEIGEAQGGHPMPAATMRMEMSADAGGGPSSAPGTIERYSRVRATFRLTTYP